MTGRDGRDAAEARAARLAEALRANLRRRKAQARARAAETPRDGPDDAASSRETGGRSGSDDG